jgi:hypothetical protein
MLVAWTALDSDNDGGLARLNSALSGSGKIAETKIQPEGIDPAAVGSHGDPVVKPAQSRTEPPPPAAASARMDPVAEEQYLTVEHRVQACRVEVARRRRVLPAEVAAGAVTLRWTVEATGRVKNAEAVAVQATDLEVAACAKRVITEWVFPKSRSGSVTVERTYRFP